MKSLADSIFFPTIASMVMVSSLALFFVAPIRPLHEMPVAGNGALYSYSGTIVGSLTIFRNGSLAMDGRSVRLAELREKLETARSNSESEWKGIRLRIHPEAPMKAVRAAWEASRSANLDAMYYAVVIPEYE